MLSANLSWKNPKEAETVGQHREQKSRQRGSSRSSGSSTASASHGQQQQQQQRPRTRDTTLSRLSRRKTGSGADNRAPKAPSPTPPGQDALAFLSPPQQEAGSPYELDGTTDERHEGNSLRSTDRAPALSSRRTSVSSNDAIYGLVLNEVQPLGPDSKVSRVTTVTITASGSNSEKEDNSRERSSSEGPRPPQLKLPQRIKSSKGLSSPKFGFMRPKIFKPPSPEPKSLSNADTYASAPEETPKAQQNTFPTRFELRKETQQLNSALHTPSNWKPPAEWQASHSPTAETPDTEWSPWGDDSPAAPPFPLFSSGGNQTQSTLATPLQIRPTSSDQQPQPPSSPSTTTFTRNLRRMEIATPTILSQHVAETWDNVVDITAAAEVTDGDGLSNMHEEFEFEKRLWVLTALGRLRFRDRLTGGAGEAGLVDKNILSLYGLEADSWFLAAKNHRSTVHSYSHNPFKSKPSHPWGRAPPNCRPLTTPIVTTVAPYSSGSFDLIISRSLPAILRSTEYPGFLRDCVKMLKPGGHLVISFVDPSPKKCGPLLARWTEGLKLKLEMQFRCTRPSELIPHWLGEIGAGAGAVEVETMDWIAVGEPSGGDQWDELRSVTGRALYRKLYESFVEPASKGERTPSEGSGVWWWEDPLIVEECRAMGTTFQLHKYLHLKE